MFRHIVLMDFSEAATAEHRQAIVDALRGLPAAIADIRSYSIGLDAGVSEGNAALAVVADFDDADAYRRYAAHPAHQKVIAELIRPVLARRVAVQHEVTG